MFESSRREGPGDRERIAVSPQDHKPSRRRHKNALRRSKLLTVLPLLLLSTQSTWVVLDHLLLLNSGLRCSYRVLYHSSGVAIRYREGDALGLLTFISSRSYPQRAAHFGKSVISRGIVGRRRYCPRDSPWTSRHGSHGSSAGFVTPHQPNYHYSSAFAAWPKKLLREAARCSLRLVCPSRLNSSSRTGDARAR